MFGRWFAFCQRRHRPVLEPQPEPLHEEEEEEEEDSPSETSTATSPRSQLPGRVNREVLWVIPTEKGAFFAHEGLAAPSREEVRWYAVWDIPGIGRWRVAGIHWGFESIAYAGILKLHYNQFKGIHWRRAGSRAEAVEIFKSEAEKFDLTEQYSLRTFGWTFCHNLERRD